MATTKRSVTSMTGGESAACTRKAKVEFGREICGSLDIAEQREWLVTNGISGYASGTVSGNLTRRYHGLVVAALHPPVGRTQFAARLEETATYDGSDYKLATNRWASGAVEPKGYLNIESFRLKGTTPPGLDRGRGDRGVAGDTRLSQRLVKSGPSILNPAPRGAHPTRGG